MPTSAPTSSKLAIPSEGMDGDQGGPGCNGAHRGALRLAALGRQVKEMLGGFEYYEREGHPVEVGSA